jgi:hypothetical protein
LEIGLIKLGADDFDKQFWVMSKVFLVRMVFLGAATVQILHSIFTYRYARDKQRPPLHYIITQYHIYTLIGWPSLRF